MIWGIEWHSRNKLDGERKCLMFENGIPFMFTTKKAAKACIDNRWGYIRERKDLRGEPHGWRIPKPVKIDIVKAGDSE